VTSVTKTGDGNRPRPYLSNEGFLLGVQFPAPARGGIHWTDCIAIGGNIIMNVNEPFKFPEVVAPLEIGPGGGIGGDLVIESGEGGGGGDTEPTIEVEP